MNIKKYVNLKNICKIMALALICNNMSVCKHAPQMFILKKENKKIYTEIGNITSTNRNIPLDVYAREYKKPNFNKPNFNEEEKVYAKNTILNQNMLMRNENNFNNTKQCNKNLEQRFSKITSIDQFKQSSNLQLYINPCKEKKYLKHVSKTPTQTKNFVYYKKLIGQIGPIEPYKYENEKEMNERDELAFFLIEAKQADYENNQIQKEFEIPTEISENEIITKNLDFNFEENFIDKTLHFKYKPCVKKKLRENLVMKKDSLKKLVNEYFIKNNRKKLQNKQKNNLKLAEKIESNKKDQDYKYNSNKIELNKLKSYDLIQLIKKINEFSAQ